MSATVELQQATSLQPATAPTDDEIRLARLGYKQELKRSLGFIENFGIAFSAMNFVGGICSLWGFAMLAGGFAGAVWMWLVVSIFSACLAAALAEVCSSLPTSGGLYFWSGKLGGDRHGPAFSWFTAYFNLAYTIAMFPGIAYAITSFFVTTVKIYVPDFAAPPEGSSFLMDPYIAFGIEVAFLALGFVLNIINDTVVAWTLRIGTIANVVAWLAVMIWLPITAPVKNSASVVFTQITDLTGWESYGAAMVLATLMPVWTLVGYDGAAHIAEETKGAQTASAKSIVNAVIVSAILGFAQILVFCFCTVDLEALLTSTYPQGVGALFVQAAGQNGGFVLMFLILFSGVFCLAATFAGGSRLLYAMARDDVIPLSKQLYWYHPTTKIPLRSLVFLLVAGIVLCAPTMGSSVVLNAWSGTATVCANVAYVLPVAAKLTVGRQAFKPGEFSLGKFSEPIGWASVVFVAYLVIVLCLPPFLPVTATTLNFAPIMISGIALLTAAGWLFKGRHYFKGPKKHVTDEDLFEMEQRYKAMAGEGQVEENGGQATALKQGDV